MYPLAKDKAGNAAWSNMHHRASLYPDSPTDKEKERMKTFLYESMRSVALLCKNCNSHIKDYLKKHPIGPALVSKKAISKYLCEMHNDTNEKTGKEIHNCHTILSEKKTCTDCEVLVTKNDLKGSFEKFKEASTSIFKALCDKHKLPYPTIKFHHCPNNATTSCTSMLIDSRNNEIVEKPIVYLHPNVFGLRTVVHEFLHYIKQFSKDTLGGLDEFTVEKEAQAILSNEFPYDKLDISDRPPTAIPVIRKDSYAASRLDAFPISKRIFDKHLRTIKRRDFVLPQQGGEEGDLVTDMLQGITQGRDEGTDIDLELAASRKFREEKVNALSFLDGLYAPFAGLFGLRAADMNMYNSPTIISNATLTLMKSQLSPIGSLLVTAVSSLGILGALALTKNGLAYGDKMLMNAFGSNMLYSTIDYMRPELKEDVVGGAMDLGEVVSHQEWSYLPRILFGESSMVGSMFAQPVSANTAQTTRAVQRQTVGTGTSNTISASSARRNAQRSAGLTPSDVTGATRDFNTGAATGGNPALNRGIAGGLGPVGAGPGIENNTVVIPSDEEEEEYESSFGAHVSDGSSFYAPVASTDSMTMRRNTIKDVFNTDPMYDNFNDEYYYDEVEGYN